LSEISSGAEEVFVLEKWHHKVLILRVQLASKEERTRLSTSMLFDLDPIGLHFGTGTRFLEELERLQKEEMRLHARLVCCGGRGEILDLPPLP
jgi:hypothetical protein